MPRAPIAIESQIIERVLAVGQPERIVLFGSRARGESRSTSDFDLFIIGPSDKPRYARAGVYYRSLATLPAEVDVMVYTPKEVEEWKNVPEAFVTTALREGVVLYERAR
jgi:predicted nucleotidyltransferase